MSPRPEADPFALDDAAYVLGALSPQERAAFEEHLTRCPGCAQSVAALAGLPALLRTVPPEVAAQVADDRHDEAPPERLLESVADEIRRRENARRRLLVAAAAVLLVVAAVGTGLLARGMSPQAEPPEPRVVALEPVRDGPLAVTAIVTGDAQGSRIDLVCRYDTSAGAASPYRTPPSYSLLVRGEDGATEQAATWRAVPGREVTVQASTALPPSRITVLEVRTGDGVPVLRGDI